VTTVARTLIDMTDLETTDRVLRAIREAEAFEEDRARDAALSAIGLRPVRFTWHRVTEEGDEVMAELGATLAYSDSAGAPHGGSNSTPELPSWPSLSIQFTRPPEVSGGTAIR
jgi:hypothetical protein